MVGWNPINKRLGITSGMSNEDIIQKLKEIENSKEAQLKEYDDFDFEIGTFGYAYNMKNIAIEYQKLYDTISNKMLDNRNTYTTEQREYDDAMLNNAEYRIKKKYDARLNGLNYITNQWDQKKKELLEKYNITEEALYGSSNTSTTYTQSSGLQTEELKKEQEETIQRDFKVSLSNLMVAYNKGELNKTEYINAYNRLKEKFNNLFNYIKNIPSFTSPYVTYTQSDKSAYEKYLEQLDMPYTPTTATQSSGLQTEELKKEQSEQSKREEYMSSFDELYSYFSEKESEQYAEQKKQVIASKYESVMERIKDTASKSGTNLLPIIIIGAILLLGSNK